MSLDRWQMNRRDIYNVAGKRNKIETQIYQQARKVVRKTARWK